MLVPPPVVFLFNDGEWGRRLLCAETVPPLCHPPHITLCHGEMGVTAAAVLVTHSFEVVAQTEVATVIGFWDPNPILRCHINSLADAEPWSHLKMGGWPRVMSSGLDLLAVASLRGVAGGAPAGGAHVPGACGVKSPGRACCPA